MAGELSLSAVRSYAVLLSQYAQAVPVQQVQVSGLGDCGNDLSQDENAAGEVVLDDLHDDPSEERCVDAEPAANAWHILLQDGLDNGPQDP